MSILARKESSVFHELFLSLRSRRSVPKTRAPRALRAHKLARAYVPTRLTRLRALSRAL